MADAPFPALVSAVQAYTADKYSQARRWENGYSDCSSFVGKGMKDLGLNPGASTTLTYLASTAWTTIPKSSMGPGDIAVNSSHMVVITGNGTAIGQENPTRNVQAGNLDDLMAGTGAYLMRRYKGGSNIQFAGYTTPNATQAGLLSVPSSVSNTFSWLTNTTNWYRVGMVLAGAALIYMTVRSMGTQQAMKLLNSSVGKKVSDSVKSKSGNGK